MPETGNIDVIATLIVKYLQDQLGNDEKEQLKQWINSSADRKAKFEELTNGEYVLRELRFWREAGLKESAIWREVEKRLIPQPVHKMGRSYWMYIAAVLFVLAGIGAGLLWFTKPEGKKQSPSIVQIKPASDVQPGGFKAKLTLADGSTIILDSATGQVVQQGNTKILNKDGRLTYSSSSKGGANSTVAFNILSTAKGEIYSLTLGDGSHVWLNSASSIRYPVMFMGNERKVAITGEVYFEVAHNAQKPFIVIANGIETQVLGTKFNINAYSDEKTIKTTLLEGKIKVSIGPAKREQSAILKPGEQAEAMTATIKVNNNIDLEEVMAWKNGLFVFNEAPLDVVMRQIARWYDVDVSYGFDNRKQPINVTGQISRFANASKVLDMLAATGWLHFTIDGKKITVLENKH